VLFVVANAHRLVWISAALSIFAGSALAEELECRWFIPATGGTVAVRCDDENPQTSPPARQDVQPGTELLGLTLAPLTQDLKDKYGIEKEINGVFVAQVDVHSEAGDRGITRGDVILKTDQEVVLTPEDMARSVESATKDGRKAIPLLLSNPHGQTRIISLSP
jgi:serine protease Do